ncbi:MAG: double-strand break repair protein AddB, partial [Rhodospirillales bacterium]|nr:double-strand break repair protein AddB [Rhodospirillales bacterium]
MTSRGVRNEDDSSPAVFTIPAGTPFVDALAAGLIERVGGEPEDLADAVVLLPTRRACRALGDAFLRLTNGRPTLLPRMRPLGDLDEDELAIAGSVDLLAEMPLGDAAGGADDIPPALSGLRRQILLARLVRAKAGRDASAEQAARLAAELGRLLDQVHTERLDFSALTGLVPDELAEHWQVTLDFLAVLSEQWPQILAAEGAIDAADRRNRLLAAQAAAWRHRPPAGPVVAAGSTGSIPATADLLKVVAELPQGCVVLPGFDTDMDEETRQALDPTHPQFGMVRLLAHLGVAAEAVRPWPPANPPVAGMPRANPERRRLIQLALWPAALTDRWGHEAPLSSAGLAEVSRIDCPGPREEAGVIALVLREALETPAQTAALVTPDRALARRVAAELRRWRIDVDDSAGVPLAHTPPATFLRLVLAMVDEDFAPVAALAALKHPLAAGGQRPGAFRTAVRRLEMTVLRGPRPAPGIDGLRAALAERGDAFGGLLDGLEQAAAPLHPLLGQPAADPVALVRAHVACAEALAATDEAAGAARLWAGEAGEAAARFLADLAESAALLESIPGRQYGGLLDALTAGRVVRPRFGRHPRLHIWGPLEARLQQADVVVLGGLNEGCWPPETQAGPWMSRPMMKAFGLPSPERRIGLSAHDFAQAFTAPRVVLTRASRVEGTPTVPSRWLARLEALLAGSDLTGALQSDRRWIGWFARLDAAGPPRPIAPPEPRPPIEARPRQLSVTQVEAWIRDPYAIFARHVLGLRPLDPLDADPAAADRGIIIHAALERFIQAYPGDLPADAEDRLIAIGREVFGDRSARPGVRAFWWPRFERLAHWFVDRERRRRAAGHGVLATEARGELALAGPGGSFRLTGRADRIDVTPAGELAIIDYKTGQVPSRKQVECGLAPQLSLEAAMAAAGAFAG